MAKDVIIVESEQKARTIAAQLAAEVETVVVRNAPVKATLLPPKDPLKREPPKFSFVLVDGGQEFFAKLSQAAGATLYLAFDSDQRGEYWAWLINEYLLGQTVGVQGVRRLHLLGLGREDLRESFRLVEPVDSDKAVGYHLRMLFNAHLAHHLKRLIGTATGPQGLPLNSETLATLFLLAERESEIRAFTPPLKWQVRVRLAAEDGEFDARLVEAYGITDDGYVRDALQSKEMVGLFRGKPFLVGEVAEEELRIEPPAPFRLMELLQEAYLAHRLMPAQVLSAVRELYEGVDVASGTVGLVSAFVPFENADTNLARARIRAQVEKRFGPAMLAAEEQEVDLKGTLLPLRPEILPADLAGTVGTVTHQVYALIHARALASQMRDAEGILRDVVFQAGESCLFRASGRVVREQGFLAAYQGQQFRELLAPSPLGNLQEGQEVRNVQIVPEQTAGFPPEYYTFEGLAGDLADFALAPDASAIGMLQRMLDGGYLALMPDGTWRCRENATTLISVMNKAFPTMKGVNLSAYFEQTVTEAATNRKPLAFAIQQFDQTMMMQGNVLVKIKMPVAPRPRVKTSRSIIKTAGVEAPPPAAAPTEEALVPPSAGVPSGEEAPVAVTPVPVVEEALVAETPEEVAVGGEETVPVEEEQETVSPPAALEVVPPPMEEPEPVAAPVAAATQELFAEAAKEAETPEPPPVAGEAGTAVAGPTKPCPDCGRPLLLKEDRFGKYWFCSGHPECRHSESYGKEVGLSLLCPLCQIGNIVSKHTPTGKPFYVCPEADCEFMAWSKPHAISCQVCDSPFLVEKKNLAGKVSLRCPRAGCNYSQPLSGEDDSTPAAAPVVPGQAPVRKKVLVRRVKGGAPSSGGVRKVRVVRRKS